MKQVQACCCQRAGKNTEKAEWQGIHDPADYPLECLEKGVQHIDGLVAGREGHKPDGNPQEYGKDKYLEAVPLTESRKDIRRHHFHEKVRYGGHAFIPFEL